MTLLGWLFLRGEESIRVIREPDAFVLRVEGPLYEREVHAFGTEHDLAEFQRTLEERLVGEGWTLAASQERRSGQERRANPRGRDRRRNGERGNPATPEPASND